MNQLSNCGQALCSDNESESLASGYLSNTDPDFNYFTRPENNML